MTQPSDDKSIVKPETEPSAITMEQMQADARIIAIEALEAKSKQQDVVLQRVLQHALNVLVAFQIRTNGRRVYLFADTYADDLETAISVAELTKLVKASNCEGIDLLPKDPQPDEPINVIDANDKPLTPGGGIFT